MRFHACFCKASDVVSNAIQMIVLGHIGVQHPGCIGQGTKFFKTEASPGTEGKRTGKYSERPADAREPFSWPADAREPVTHSRLECGVSEAKRKDNGRATEG